MSQAAASATGSLPPVISEYLAASDRGDAEAIARCFAEDAVVVDEGQQWRGTAAIRRWRATVATAYQYTVQVTGAKALDEMDGHVERHDVYIHLEGNFPGGQVDLTDRFALRDGRIASLEIVPAEATR
jgi:ketosteroid isomerase-like protein